jgi:hypothetical protein
MEKYNYMEKMTEDVLEYISETYTEEEIKEKLEDRYEWENELHDDLWAHDSVTGNASGSYTCNSWRAEEYIAHNLDLLAEAMATFGDDSNALKNGAEWCDVTIRCYLLGDAISKALDTIEEEEGK